MAVIGGIRDIKQLFMDAFSAGDAEKVAMF